MYVRSIVHTYAIDFIGPSKNEKNEFSPFIFFIISSVLVGSSANGKRNSVATTTNTPLSPTIQCEYRLRQNILVVAQKSSDIHGTTVHLWGMFVLEPQYICGCIDLT